MDGEGVQQAFCPLLWRANGGKLNARGLPVITDEPIRGMCTRAYDCFTCELMQEELSFYQPGTVWWLCPECVARIKSRRDIRGQHIKLLGFYTEGECQNAHCHRADRHSPILQLLLGDIYKEGG
jgi:hypothetical protein